MAFVENPEAYDVLLLAGWLVPGEVRLDVMRRLAMQTARGSGDDGSEPKIRGLKPCEFTIKARLFTDEDERAWEQLAPKIMDLAQPTRRNQVSVVHPQLARMGISRCCVIGIGETKPMNGDPIEVTIECQSTKRRDGATHKPKPKNDGGPAKGRLGLSSFDVPGFFSGPDTNGMNYAESLKDRKYTPVQQARIDNGIDRGVVEGNVYGPALGVLLGGR